MTTTMEEPVSTSSGDLPKAITDFVHVSIQAMDERQLDAWKRESEKIMRRARRHSGVSLAVRPVADETLRTKSGVR